MSFLDLQFLAMVIWVVTESCVVWWAVKESIPEKKYQAAKWMTVANSFFWIGMILLIEIMREMLWER